MTEQERHDGKGDRSLKTRDEGAACRALLVGCESMVMGQAVKTTGPEATRRACSHSHLCPDPCVRAWPLLLTVSVRLGCHHLLFPGYLLDVPPAPLPLCSMVLALLGLGVVSHQELWGRGQVQVCACGRAAAGEGEVFYEHCQLQGYSVGDWQLAPPLPTGERA